MILFTGFNSFGQSVDVLFWIDNSNSISDTEFSEMKTSIQNITYKVLNCNRNNKVAIAHYGGSYSGSNNMISRIWIESDFTNNYSVASSFSRRTLNVGGGDRAHEALSLIGNALDNVPNTYIVSSQKTLNRTSSNSLIIVLFSDAMRSTGDTYLVNFLSSAYGTDGAFLNYTTFKANRKTTFFVVHPDGDSSAIKASATIASAGYAGSYLGPIEGYLSDPDSNSPFGRYLFLGLSLNPMQITTISENICGLIMPCPGDVALISPTNNVTGIDNRQASNSITASNVVNNGAIGIYHAGTTVVLKPGFHGVGGSKFRGYIEGCSGQFVGLRTSEEDENLNFSMTEVKQDLFTLSPNPATDRTVIASNKMMAQVEVKSLTGTIFYSGKVNDKSHELYIGNYPKGFYMVMVTTDTGEVEVKKLIKD